MSSLTSSNPIEDAGKSFKFIEEHNTIEYYGVTQPLNLALGMPPCTTQTERDKIEHWGFVCMPIIYDWDFFLDILRIYMLFKGVFHTFSIEIFTVFDEVGSLPQPKHYIKN